MTLKELKAPFADNVASTRCKKLNLECLNLNEVAEKYLKTSSEDDRNIYISYLVIKTWSCLNNLYFKQDKTNLTVEECYDIYLEALQYVIHKQIWNDPSSKLHGDAEAFCKAVNVAAKSLKVNYIKAQHTQKRVLNYNILSIDSISEDCSDGYFLPYYDEDICVETTLNHLINNLFNSKHYLHAFILDAILNFNIFSVDNYEVEMSYRKLRKHLHIINVDFCKYFAYKYSVDEQEAIHSPSYFNKLSQHALDESILSCLNYFKNNEIIRETVLC